MTLRKARLCLDCEELHDQRQCPVCASEAYAYLTQWVPAPERRKKPRPAIIAATPGAVGVARRVAVGDSAAGAFLHSLVHWWKQARQQVDIARMRETGELR